MQKIILSLFIFSIIFGSCKKDADLGRGRLFRPVISGQLSADSNTIEAAWQRISGARSYEFRMSRDTFKTVDRSSRYDTNAVAIKGLLFNQLYQVQVRALATDSVYNSGWTNLGAIKTLSSILMVPGISDITLNSVRVRWASKGAPVTAIRILKTADSTEVAKVTLTPADRTNEFRVIAGLQASTKYTILLYSETDVRGNVDFSTSAPLSGNIIDLTGITGRPSVLADTIPQVAAGSTILLKRDQTYNISTGIGIGKSLTIISAPDLSIPTQAKIFITANFSFAAGSVIESLEFNDVFIYSDNYTSRYLFNNTNSATVGSIKFLNSRIEIFRGILRLQSGAVSLNNLIIDNCILDSLQGYGILTVDNISCKVDNIKMTNSTIYKAEKVFVSKQSSTSVTIESCTFNESPAGGGSSYYIDYNTAGTNEVTAGVSVLNCIFGPGKANAAANTSVRDYRVAATTNVITGNNFRTSDHVTSGNDFLGIIISNRTSPVLWVAPQVGNFKIADNTFTGRSTAGDPRWRL